ncbi:protein of unknown function (plasmid) [Azospirillum baldaniorum]|uniref:Uncharacterized protein n=1 Tax=Azospirillum baldaniorum TaxID=1064539 RepID=A0A9P1JVH7_9PROT|nr:protein of unknown function [Azospirillum baldaniorum]
MGEAHPYARPPGTRGYCFCRTRAERVAFRGPPEGARVFIQSHGMLFS